MSKTINVGFEEFIEENVQSLIETMGWMKETDMKLCSGIDHLREFIDMIISRGKDGKKPYCVIDFETTGLNTRMIQGKSASDIVGVGLASDKNTGIYVPVNHKEGSEFNVPEKLVLEELSRLCKCCIIIVHNAKFDLSVFRNHNIIINNFEDFDDTLILARLYDAGQKQIDLKNLSKKLLTRPMIELKQITKGTQRLDMVSPKIGYIYGASDALCTFGLFDLFIASQIIIDQKAIYNLEKRLVFVVMQMESNLVLIDKEYLKKEKERISSRLKQIEDEVHEIAKDKEFNLGSTQQLGRILFEKLNYEYPSKTKTASGQYMTDTATLEKIESKYPMVKLIIEYRELEKSLGTYIENLLNNCDENSCVKLSFNQNGTDTGRFSSPGGHGLLVDGYSGVNVQAIPANYSASAPDVRKAFKARPGKKLVAMDFSGEELRVATNLSGETKWIEEFLHGSADLHTATAKAIYKREEITKIERQTSKTVNFLVLYGGGSKGLSEQAKLSEIEARRILSQFFEGLPKLKKWLERERALAKKQKFARTVFGRIRPLHMFYDSGDRGLEAHADRCATNFLVQGACADIMKIVMVRVASWIKENNLEDEIKILITMHDELVFEMPENKLDEYVPQLNNIMCLSDILQKVFNWPVPLTIDAEYGDTWHVDHDLFKEKPELKSAPLAIQFYQAGQVVEKEVPVTTPPESPSVEVPVINSESPVNLSKEEKVPESPASDEPSKAFEIPKSEIEDEIIYKIRDRSKITLLKLNQIITFLTEDMENKLYEGPIRVLKVYDKENNILSVSNLRIRSDCFYALARYEGI
jgi:DNA polymerase-1